MLFKLFGDFFISLLLFVTFHHSNISLFESICSGERSVYAAVFLLGHDTCSVLLSFRHLTEGMQTYIYCSTFNPQTGIHVNDSGCGALLQLLYFAEVTQISPKGNSHRTIKHKAYSSPPPPLKKISNFKCGIKWYEIPHTLFAHTIKLGFSGHLHSKNRRFQTSV